MPPQSDISVKTEHMEITLKCEKAIILRWGEMAARGGLKRTVAQILDVRRLLLSTLRKAGRREVL